MKDYIECINSTVARYFKMLDEYPDAEIILNIIIEDDRIEINLEPWESISNYKNIPHEFTDPPYKFPEPKKTKLF